MASGIVAALIAVVALGFVEGIGAFYPARDAWRRLRRQNGRRAVRAMRERFEGAAAARTPRLLAGVLAVLVAVWIAVSPSLLDKFWYELLLDVTPYLIVCVALLRLPPALLRVAERMRGYERDVGEDPDGGFDSNGPSALSL
jgi:hypothetical protein